MYEALEVIPLGAAVVVSKQIRPVSDRPKTARVLQVFRPVSPVVTGMWAWAS